MGSSNSSDSSATVCDNSSSSSTANTCKKTGSCDSPVSTTWDRSSFSTSRGRVYITPKTEELVPELSVCRDRGESTKHHCDTLDRVLFYCSNINRDENKSDPFFKQIATRNGSSDMTWEIGYHISELPGSEKDKVATIETCHKFKNVCDELLVGSHPLSKEAINIKTQQEEASFKQETRASVEQETRASIEQETGTSLEQEPGTSFEQTKDIHEPNNQEFGSQSDSEIEN